MTSREKKQHIAELKDLLDQLGDWTYHLVFSGGTAARIYAAAAEFSEVDFEPTVTEEKEGVKHYIEFLTDDHREKVHKIGGVAATGLSYIRASFESAVPFSIDGRTGLVASPAAFVFHKGLTFTRRKMQEKKFKDIYYITYVCDQVLGGTKSAVKEVCRHAEGYPDDWSKTFALNMRSIGDWTDDEIALVTANDPEGEIVAALVRQTAKSLSEILEV